jgi:hypothetical protein
MNTNELLEALHNTVATELLSRIKSGEATAAEFSAAIKFLKDNGIECIATPDNPLGSLAASLPVFSDDELVDD